MSDYDGAHPMSHDWSRTRTRTRWVTASRAADPLGVGSDTFERVARSVYNRASIVASVNRIHLLAEDMTELHP